MNTLEGLPRITPFLWFDANAEEAVDFYMQVFKNSRKGEALRRSADDPGGKAGSVVTIGFELEGMHFTALNGGPYHQFNESVSFVIRCENQEEIDYYWERLIDGGGAEIACGWLKDKFGLRWQVVPSKIGTLIKNPKAMQAMMQMKKLDMAELERAGKS